MSNPELVKEYADNLSKVQTDYSKNLLNLAGGSLALSIAFLKDIVGNNVSTFNWSLHVAWICLILSLASNLLGSIYSQYSFKNLIAYVQNNYCRTEYKTGLSYSNCTWWFNTAAGVLFLLGIVFLALFSAMNHK